MVLCQSHRIYVSAIHEAHKRELLPLHKLLDNHPVGAELVHHKHIVQSRFGFGVRHSYYDALTRRKTVVFYHYRRPVSLDISHRFSIIGKNGIVGSRDIVLHHQVFGKLLARLYTGGVLRGTKNSKSVLCKEVGYTGCQSRFGSYDGKVYRVSLSKPQQFVDFRIAGSDTMSYTCDTGIAWGTVYLGYFWRFS